MKIRFDLLSNNVSDPTVRTRGIMIIDELVKLGVRAKVWNGNEKTDIIITQYNPGKLPYSRKCCDKLIYDCNDAVFTRNRESLDRILYIIDNTTDFITTGSPMLESIYRRFGFRSEYVPDPFDDTLEVKKEKPKLPIILWSGMQNNYKYLFPLISSLDRLYREIEFRLVVLTHSSDIDRFIIKYFYAYQWSKKLMGDYLGLATIGICPAAQNMWCWCKAPSKAATLLYNSVAVVATDTPSHREVLQDDNGLLPYYNDEWYNPLHKLLTDDAFRKSSVEKHRQFVIDTYSPKVVAQKWIKIIHTLYGIKI
jgi:glycosyltransferase involved in cell wall biosynthesis